MKGFLPIILFSKYTKRADTQKKRYAWRTKATSSQLIDIVREHGNNKGRPGNFLVWLSLILVLKNLFNLQVMPEVCKHGELSVMEITHFWCSYQVCMRSNHITVTHFSPYKKY